MSDEREKRLQQKAVRAAKKPEKERETIEQKQQVKAVEAAKKTTTTKPAKSTKQAKAVGRRMYRVGGTGPTFKITTKRLKEQSDRFFEKSGYMSLPEVEKRLLSKTLPKDPDKLRPKNATQALNRLGYAASEMAIGGAVELGLPFSLSAVPPLSRRADRGYRILGGVLTPSPADLLASQIVSKLAKSKAWNKITGRYGEVQVTQLEKEAAREIEKLKGSSGYSTAEIRKGVNKIYRNLDEVAEFYRKHPELATPDRSSAGAARVPKVVQEFETYLDDLGWDMDEYIDFMKNRAPTLPAGAVVHVLAGSMDRGTTLDETAESLTEFYRDAPDSALISQDKSKVIPKTEEKTTPKTGGAVGPEPQAVEEVTEQKTKTTPKTTTETTLTEPTTTEEIEEEEPILTPKPSLPPKDREEMKRIRLKLYAGPVSKYQAEFDYKRGKTQTVTVEARSFIEAMNKAQRGRRLTKRHPSSVELVKVK